MHRLQYVGLVCVCAYYLSLQASGDTVQVQFYNVLPSSKVVSVPRDSYNNFTALEDMDVGVPSENKTSTITFKVSDTDLDYFAARFVYMNKLLQSYIVQPNTNRLMQSPGSDDSVRAWIKNNTFGCIACAEELKASELLQGCIIACSGTEIVSILNSYVDNRKKELPVGVELSALQKYFLIALKQYVGFGGDDNRIDLVDENTKKSLIQEWYISQYTNQTFNEYVACAENYYYQYKKNLWQWIYNRRKSEKNEITLKDLKEAEFTWNKSFERIVYTQLCNGNVSSMEEWQLSGRVLKLDADKRASLHMPLLLVACYIKQFKDIDHIVHGDRGGPEYMHAIDVVYMSKICTFLKYHTKDTIKWFINFENNPAIPWHAFKSFNYGNMCSAYEDVCSNSWSGKAIHITMIDLTKKKILLQAPYTISDVSWMLFKIGIPFLWTWCTRNHTIPYIESMNILRNKALHNVNDTIPEQIQRIGSYLLSTRYTFNLPFSVSLPSLPSGIQWPPFIGDPSTINLGSIYSVENALELLNNTWNDYNPWTYLLANLSVWAHKAYVYWTIAAMIFNIVWYTCFPKDSLCYVDKLGTLQRVYNSRLFNININWLLQPKVWCKISFKKKK